MICSGARSAHQETRFRVLCTERSDGDRGFWNIVFILLNCLQFNILACFGSALVLPQNHVPTAAAPSLSEKLSKSFNISLLSTFIKFFVFLGVFEFFESVKFDKFYGEWLDLRTYGFFCVTIAVLVYILLELAFASLLVL